MTRLGLLLAGVLMLPGLAPAQEFQPTHPECIAPRRRAAAST